MGYDSWYVLHNAKVRAEGRAELAALIENNEIDLADCLTIDDDGTLVFETNGEWVRHYHCAEWFAQLAPSLAPGAMLLCEGEDGARWGHELIASGIIRPLRAAYINLDNVVVADIET